MNTAYIQPIVLIFIANIIFWYKGQAKAVFGLDWSPWQWWLYTSLATNYLSLYAWWRLIELSNVWTAGVTWGICSLTVELILNSYFISFSWKGAVALILCLIAGLIAHS